ncbi:Imm8 family immunity protein [Nonomuraea sp. NPDC001699]
MRAQVPAFRWPDLELGRCIDYPAYACELLEMYVGPQEEPGEERFQLTVSAHRLLPLNCDSTPFHRPPLALRTRAASPEVAKWLSDRIAVQEVPTSTELAEKIGRVGEWEFEDYDG